MNRLAALTPVVRLWHLVTALIALAALVTQLVLVIRGVDVLVVDGRIAPTPTRVIRFLSYFTVESNILVALIAISLMLRPDRDGRVWRAVRLASLFGITITFFTYLILLRPLVNLHGIPALTDVAFHYVTPILAVVGWLLFGPRPRVDEHTLAASLIFPALYVGYTLVHGAIGHWYPYPFIDVTAIGYGAALRNGLGLVVLMVGVGALFRYVDHLMSRPAGETVAEPTEKTEIAQP